MSIYYRVNDAGFEKASKRDIEAVCELTKKEHEVMGFVKYARTAGLHVTGYLPFEDEDGNDCIVELTNLA